MRTITLALMSVILSVSLEIHAKGLESLPIGQAPEQKQIEDVNSISVTIRNKCQKWLMIKISQFNAKKTNTAQFKISLPAGTEILGGNSASNIHYPLFTIAPRYKGQILDVCAD